MLFICGKQKPFHFLSVMLVIVFVVNIIWTHRNLLHNDSPSAQHKNLSTFASNTTKRGRTTRLQESGKSNSTLPWVNTAVSPRFAYAYIVGGCDPDDPTYRNYIYDILISTYNQRQEGSKAHVVVLIQIAYKFEYDVLPEEDVRLLNAMNIQLQYIPKASDESFYRTMLDKFRILRMTQYDRIIFMDSDVMALGNLDYIFDLSIKGIIKNNLVVAGRTEPANGGFFMLAPEAGDWERLLEIIRKREERGRRWNRTIGWGHVFDEDSYELSSGKRSTAWNFHGSFADQGLLYQWVKYEKRSVTILLGATQVQNWDVGASGRPYKETTKGLLETFRGLSRRNMCWAKRENRDPCLPPRCDFHHFTASKKPWLLGPPPVEELTEEHKDRSARHYWFYILSVLNDKLDMGLDLQHWKKSRRPLLGLFPRHSEMKRTRYYSTQTD